MAPLIGIAELLEHFEGVRSCVYQDGEGYWTIGTGICVDERVKGAGLRPEEIDYITRNLLNIASRVLAHEFSWFFTLDLVRRAVVISMYWQVGSLKRWPKFCNAMAVRDYTEAAKEMLDSKVARRQDPGQRWEIQSEMMRTGNWPTVE